MVSPKATAFFQQQLSTNFQASQAASSRFVQLSKDPQPAKQKVAADRSFEKRVSTLLEYNADISQRFLAGASSGMC